MNRFHWVVTGLLGLTFWMYAGSSWAQQPPANGAPVHLIVTAEPKHGNNVPTINREDVKVYEGHDQDTVTDWIPAQGDRAALEFFILLDDNSSSSLGSQLEDLRQFIAAQPPTTLIGIAYMQNGTAQIVQNPTNDHVQAAKALRLPMGNGGGNASPYFSLTDLVKRWPPSNARHEVLMVSDGVDRFYGTGDLQDPYLDAAIDDAGKAGVVVSAIYSPGVGHFGHSYWQAYWGQIYLSQMADKTGGEAYYIGFSGAPVSFSPYLEDLTRRLQHQYLLAFIPKPEKKAGWHNVRLATEVPNVDLVSAGRVYVQAQQ
ncbi:MAG TPA: hypothetical protein VFO46_09915 [Candidatus Sulfotelmatobacter sp.]|nr:hypothetical protein [Candidatus Sulfotelmatobacter sp.]